ncbi:MAG TPA: DUF6766 family protein [Verrucomicrobiae bacterium]|nr:DUF6766 family protein [Verrucomicrobiae bacterium]
MGRWLKEHSLSLVVFGLFAVFLVGHSIAGFRHYNEQQQIHSQPEVTYAEYVTSGDFVESVFENWESEFLQMGMYVFLTAFLYQKGSAESKKPYGKEAFDAEPRASKYAPWPVKRGGWVLKLYENSLSIILLLMFLLSFWLHAAGGARATCEEDQVHGQTDCHTTTQYMHTSKFWYESFQNWQSEFLAVGALVVLSIYFRQKGSPESKPVNTPHNKTGAQ